MKNYFGLIVLLTLILAGCAPKTEHNRKFIAHMGYSCRRTIAGENSLEAIRYAARAGFQTIELDVCLSKDSIPMAIHGYGLRPWLLDKDGNKVDHALRVKDFTAKELKEDFIVRTDNPEARTQIATLEEHLKLCKELGLLPFIEPKEYDATGRHYLDLMECADSIMGRGNYIITSNNFANRVIRDTLGVDDVKLMGILYQPMMNLFALNFIYTAAARSKFIFKVFLFRLIHNESFAMNLSIGMLNFIYRSVPELTIF